MDTHKPWCAKVIAINNQTPWNVRCDCKPKKPRAKKPQPLSAQLTLL